MFLWCTKFCGWYYQGKPPKLLFNEQKFIYSSHYLKIRDLYYASQIVLMFSIIFIKYFNLTRRSMILIKEEPRYNWNIVESGILTRNPLCTVIIYHWIFNTININDGHHYWSRNYLHFCSTSVHPRCSGVRVVKSLVFCTMLYRLLFFLLFICPFSVGHCIVCPSNYDFWYLQVFFLFHEIWRCIPNTHLHDTYCQSFVRWGY
jgi:hypothetical protein